MQFPSTLARAACRSQISMSVTQCGYDGCGFVGHFYHQDHRFSVTAMTNSVGQVVEQYAYDSHGKWTTVIDDADFEQKQNRTGVFFVGRALVSPSP